jgi:hypothetical protein
VFNFHVLRFQTHFGRSRERQVQFSSFVLPDPFWAVPRALGPLYMFCAPGPVLGGIEGIRFSFHVLRSHAHFGQDRGRRVQRVSFSYFVLSDSFSVVPRVSGPFLMFCALVLIVGGTEGVESHFHILRSRTLFRQFRGCRVPLSCFALPVSFWAISRASGSTFMFCTPGLIFVGTEGVGSHFHVLHSHTHFRRY